jgi:hypothetical protein
MEINMEYSAISFARWEISFGTHTRILMKHLSSLMGLTDRFLGRPRARSCGRDVCGSDREGPQAVCRERSQLLLIEPRGVPNTGEAGGQRTAEQDVRI